MRSAPGVGRQGWDRLRREGQAVELVHGDDEQCNSDVNFRWRMGAVMTAWVTRAQASAVAKAGQHRKPAVPTSAAIEAAANRRVLFVLCRLRPQGVYCAVE